MRTEQLTLTHADVSQLEFSLLEHNRRILEDILELEEHIKAHQHPEGVIVQSCKGAIESYNRQQQDICTQLTKLRPLFADQPRYYQNDPLKPR
jgi:CHASE3 domain sensor protein